MLIRTAPRTIAAFNQFHINYSRVKNLKEKVLEVLKENHILLYAEMSDLDLVDGDLIKVSLTKGFNNLVKKDSDIERYKGRFLALLDYDTIHSLKIIPLFEITDYHSILPIKNSFYRIRTYIAKLIGSIPL
jgi:hypothetical protein